MTVIDSSNASFFGIREMHKSANTAKISDPATGQGVNFTPSTQTSDATSATASQAANKTTQTLKNENVGLLKNDQAQTLFLTQKMAVTPGATFEAKPLDTENTEEDESSNVVSLETSNGKRDIDLDTYFDKPNGDKNMSIEDVSFMLPSAETIGTLNQHAQSKLKGLMAEYGIPEGPKSITFGNAGEMIISGDYSYKDEFNAMLQENPAMEKELRTINALSSQYVGLQKAASGTGNSKNYADIRLDFDHNGDLTIKADDEKLLFEK